MPSNNKHDSLLDSLATMGDETPEEADRRVKADKLVHKALTTLNPLEDIFESTDVVTLSWRKRGKTHKREIPIRSIPGDILTRILRLDEYIPSVPIKENPEATSDADRFTEDRDHPEFFQRAKEYRAWEASVRPLKVLYGLDCDLLAADGSGDIAWSRDRGIYGEEYEAQGLKSLRRMGFTDTHMQALARAIDQLNAEAEEEARKND